MEGLINKKLFKVMSLLSQPEIIWDMKTECEVPKTEISYKELGKFINIEEWIVEYYSLYKQWLHDDCGYIYDISSAINQKMIKAVVEYNNLNENKLFYWFDVDRSINEAFEWKFCPISNTELIELGNEFHPNNRMISSVYPLVFPQIG